MLGRKGCVVYAFAINIELIIELWCELCDMGFPNSYRMHLSF